MDASIIIISDSGESDELSSLTKKGEASSTNKEIFEVNSEDSEAGNPTITSSVTGNPSKRRGDNVTCAGEATIPMDTISSDNGDFDMQKIIAKRLQSLGTFTPQQAMCSQGKLREDGRHRPDKQERGERGPKTWSRRVAEHLARKTSVSQKSEVSTEDSAIEDNDSLPDLEDDLPDLSALCTVTQSTYTHHKTSLPKRKSVDSLRQKHHKERHFLDTFEPSPKHRKLSETVDSPQGELCENEHVSGNPQSCQSKRRRDRISQELQAGSAPVDQEKYKIFTFPVDSKSKASTETRRQAAEAEARHVKAKFAGVRFMQDLTAFPFGTDRLCSDFVNLQTSCLDDLSDDLTDLSNFSNCMDLLEDFCSKRKPPVVVIDKIIKNGFFSAVDEKMLTRTYHVVLKVWQRFPDMIRIDVPSVLVAGDVLQKHLQNNDLTAESTSSLLSGLRRDRPGLRQARLYFQLFVKGLQLSLGQCTLADQKSVNKCLAFTCLSSEGSKTLIKQVTHWLEFCLVVRQPELVPVAKAWMCELHSLLGACVLVSRDRQEAAKRLAPELKRTYKYLTDLNAKKLLLQSFSCPLLCFYVLRLVMEDQCESTIVSSQFPPSIHEVVNNYYFALPPQDHLTPPPSPSDDGHDNGRGHFRMFSVQSCEELAMLVYFISKSYITCKQRRLSSDLRQQILKGPNLSSLTSEEKNSMQRSVQEFGTHLQNHSPELSAPTRTYLALLDCLCLSS